MKIHSDSYNVLKELKFCFSLNSLLIFQLHFIDF